MKNILKKRFIFLLIKVLVFLMAFYTLLHLNFFNSINIKRSKGPQKYILYECSGNGLCGGLIDRFKGIMNAYAWSLFAKRQLIINITKPCDFINLMVPNRVKWNIYLEQLVKYGDLKEDYTIHKINRLDNSRYKSELKNMDITHYQKESKVISIFTNLEWISAYAQNKYV
jgi:hypothetical protein